jgi:type IV secretion system protein VirB9
MMRPTRLFLAAMFACAAIPAHATDNRIRTLRYDSNQIVTVPGRWSIQSTIEFNSDEHIESVAVGNSAAWQVTPNHRASLLFVKPLVRLSRTNMTVITDKRTYMFDLVTGRREAAPIYSLRFTYPADPVQAVKLAAAPAPTPPISAPASPVEINFGWRTKGAGEVLPGRVFDDRQSLYLSWDQNAPLPAISTMSNDGREGSLNYRLSGQYIVISPVPDNVMLRYGNKTATAFRVGSSRTVSSRNDQVQITPSKEVVAPPRVASSPGVLEAAQPQQAVAAETQVANSAPTPDGQAGLIRKLAYPELNDEHLTDSHHE